MTRHLSDDDLLSVLEETAPGSARRHLEACDACRVRLEEAREGLRVAREAQVPEPSPLYWEAFRRQVGRRIEGERSLWRRFQWAPALAAAAGLVAALSVRVPAPGASRLAVPAAALPAWSPLPQAEDDPGLLVLQALAPSAEDPLGACRDVTACLVDLSEEESQALADVLSHELGRKDL